MDFRTRLKKIADHIAGRLGYVPRIELYRNNSRYINQNLYNDYKNLAKQVDEIAKDRDRILNNIRIAKQQDIKIAGMKRSQWFKVGEFDMPIRAGWYEFKFTGRQITFHAVPINGRDVMISSRYIRLQDGDSWRGVVNGDVDCARYDEE